MLAQRARIAVLDRLPRGVRRGIDNALALGAAQDKKSSGEKRKPNH